MPKCRTKKLLPSPFPDDPNEATALGRQMASGFVPALAAQPEFRGECSICHCTETHACRLPDLEVCHWVNAERTLCSYCAGLRKVDLGHGYTPWCCVQVKSDASPIFWNARNEGWEMISKNPYPKKHKNHGKRVTTRILFCPYCGRQLPFTGEDR
jgi:hypothetical protein